MEDNPRRNIEPLTDTNYNTWSVQVKWVLIEKDLWSTVESGLVTEPTAKAKALINELLRVLG